MPIHSVPAVASTFLPHGYCYLWNRPLLLTHLVSDLIIGASYVVISFALAALVHRARRDIPFRVIFLAFGLFIIACGMTHFMEVWTLWRPAYWLAGAVKVVTAAASVATAAAMPFMLPRVHTTIRDAKLARDRELAAARTAALEEQNAILEAQAAELARQREDARALAGELERTNAELRRVAAEAEASRRAADAANRAKSEFLAVMSHELRTPLNAIGGFAELIAMGLRGPVTEAQREDLGRIRRSQAHLLSLITDILDFSRIEATGVSYDLGQVSLQEVLAETGSMVEPQARRRSIALRVQPCSPTVAAWADAEKVRQIVLNLLSNAIKYTPAGGRVWLACGSEGGYSYVRVADTGIGVPPEHQEMIFEPFVQLDRGLTRKSEGTGLGLAISRQLAQGMRGELTLESEPGVGSTFTLRLPATEGRVAA